MKSTVVDDNDVFKEEKFLTVRGSTEVRRSAALAETDQDDLFVAGAEFNFDD